MKLKQVLTLIHNRPAAILFVLLTLLGIWLHRDYGLSWDETISLVNGLVSINYVSEVTGIPELIGPYKPLTKPLIEWTDRDYGVAFEAPSVALGIALKLRDSREFFFLRHLLTFFVFLAGGYAVYRIALLRSDEKWAAYLVLACYVLSPRQFAEGFYNSKDIVFMGVLAGGLFANLMFLKEPLPFRGLMAALLSALAIDVRIMGIILPVSLLGVLGLRALKREISLKIVPSLIVYLLTLPIFVTLFWPYLWSDPVNHFLESFANMSKFRWGGEVLVNGDRFPATDLPWFYAPLWMLVTIPPYFSALILVGGVITLRNVLRSSYRLWGTEKEMLDFVFLGLSIGPIGIVILMNSVLYDGWRQLYFVYPALLLLALPGLEVLGRAVSSVNQRLVWIFFLPLLHPLIWMIQAHPYQNVYFNAFAGKDRFQRWEMDYWGLANREAIEYIVNRDNRDTIKVGALSWTPLERTLLILNPEDRRRVSITETGTEPDYWITNFRSVKGNLLEPPPGFEEEYRIIVDEEPVLLIFKRVL